MEEDIKMLQEMIKRQDKNAFDIYRKAPNTKDYLGTIKGNEILAIEHLIEKYKEIEEENIKLLEVKISVSAHNVIDKLERQNAFLRERLEEIEKRKIDKEG